MNNKQNRNDKCNCNSGKKYKHCCYSKDQVVSFTESPSKSGLEMMIIDKENLMIVSGSMVIKADNKESFDMLVSEMIEGLDIVMAETFQRIN